MKLINLEELIKYHPYHICTFADLADVTQDLLEAALRGEEELKPAEVMKIARYISVPYQVLTCETMIMLSEKRYRHREMIDKLCEKLYRICDAEEKGSKEAARYMQYRCDHSVNLIVEFRNRGKVTYCRYLGVKHELESYLLFIANETRKPRGRKNKA